MGVAKFLIDLDQYFATGTFVKRSTIMDTIKEMTAKGEKPTWKSEDLAIDAIFSQMLQLPAPEHKLVYYHSLIVETCKAAAGAIAPSLGRAIRFLYRSLDQSRFRAGLPHNGLVLTPYEQFRLPLEVAGVVSFASGALVDFSDIVQGRRRGPPTPGTAPYSAEGKQLVQLLKRKAPETDIQPVLDVIHNTAATVSPNTDPLLASTDAYVTALCFIGSKSLSHVLSYIERCKERLLSLQSASARQQIITSVVDYWLATNPGVAVNIVDKLLNYTILSPTDVLVWALSDPARLDAGRSLANSWAYEMVSRTITKVTGRVRQIVAARATPGLSAEQIAALDETLARSARRCAPSSPSSRTRSSASQRAARPGSPKTLTLAARATRLRVACGPSSGSGCFGARRPSRRRLSPRRARTFPGPKEETVDDVGAGVAEADGVANGNGNGHLLDGEGEGVAIDDVA
ncbi:hypothetical protein MRB53_037098 [Persea americana]|nr:hypothetical protein MRB53_037098 [Persea americana]